MPLDAQSFDRRRHRFNELAGGLTKERNGIGTLGLSPTDAEAYRKQLDAAIAALEAARTIVALEFQRRHEQEREKRRPPPRRASAWGNEGYPDPV